LIHAGTYHKGPEGKWRYISTLSLTFVIHQGGRSMPCPSCFSPGGRYFVPTIKETGEHQDQPGWLHKISPPSGYHIQTTNPAANYYNSYVILDLF